jgi:hypothetical protein
VTQSVISILGLGLVFVLSSCGEGLEEVSPDSIPAGSGAEPAPEESPLAIRFVDMTEDVGLDFVHQSGPSDDYSLPAVMGGGVAVLDYDSDGDLDIYLVNSGNARNRLFRQEPDGRFRDVTESSGLGDSGYGMGCAIGDYDNDGDLDVFVTNWGQNALYRNNGRSADGRVDFSEVAAEVGLGGSHFSTSSIFLDYDRDGYLDLYVTQYVDFDPRRICTQEGGRRDFCGPTQFPGVSDTLYRNLGGRGFRDVSDETGVAGTDYAGLGVVSADLNDDGWMDIYVANDADPNNLWINQGDGTFADEAIVSGAAFSGYGVAEAGMGIAVGDSDGDGDLDLFVSHLVQETNTHYENRGPEGFEDTTVELGLAASSVSSTGFGTAFFDYDNDGDLDLAVVNGAVKRRSSADLSRPEWFWSPYAERNLLFRNMLAETGRRKFVNVSEEAGPLSGLFEVSRGLLPADIDGDGDLDLLVTNIQGRARLYRNEGGDSGSWVEIRVLEPRLGRESLGAKVTVLTAAAHYVRHVIPFGGYLSGGEGRIHLGLGKEESVLGFIVRWPDGSEERFAGGSARRVVELRRGEGD